jgi:hypothetical protein
MQGRPVKFTRRKDLAQLEGTPRLMLRGDPKTTGCPIYRQPNFRMQQTNPTHHPYCANGALLREWRIFLYKAPKPCRSNGYGLRKPIKS